MDTIDQLIKDGNALFSRITLDGEPDWQSEGANIPDDAYPEEGGMSTTVTAADAADAGEWVNFDYSLGIPRREMPQIKSGDRAAMVQFFRARGIE